MNKKIVAVLALALAAALMLVLAGCGSGSGSSSQTKSDSSTSAQTEASDNKIEVPDFTDRYAATAAAKAVDLNLVPVLKSDNGQVVVNPLNWRVVDQDPFPGEKVDKGSTIILKVTRDDDGKDTSDAIDSIAIVPSVIGQEADDAEKQLEDMGLKVEIESDNGKKVMSKKNWTVVSQFPEEGTVVAKRATVKITVEKTD